MSDLFAGEIFKAAGLSSCGHYRWWLERSWEPTKPFLAWVMLNPSTADAEHDDPTIKRCIGFSRDWGFGGLVVVNLFAYRSTDPGELEKQAAAGVDVVGELNDEYIIEQTDGRRILVAWGAEPMALQRTQRIAELLRPAVREGRVECLGLTAMGQPKHPLYLSKYLKPVLCVL